MRSTILALACAGGLAVATGAGAETYSILKGEISDAASGETSSLTGTFEANLMLGPGLPVDPGMRSVSVDDFEFQSGNRSFLPQQPIEYDGLKPIFWISMADQIWFNGDVVKWLRLRSGGELVAESEDEVTFRFLEFRSDARSGGRAVGQLPDSALPRRFQLTGTLHEVDQTFRILDDECTLDLPAQPLPLFPTPGCGTVETGGAVVRFESFDLSQDQTVEFQPPEGGAIRVSRVTGGDLSIVGGELRGNGSVYVVNPERVVLDGGGGASADLPDVPTLEELGISAPDGAEVTLDANGVLTIASDGYLSIEGPFPEIPGLTRLVIIAGGGISISTSIVLPPGVPLEIDTGEIGDPPVIVQPLCFNGLRPLLPTEEREIGSFSLVASAAQPVEIDVRPWSRRNRVNLFSGRPIVVALLGSEELDVRDVYESSLRFGPGEAEPLASRGRLRVFRMDLNRDRRADLLALFDVRDTGIALGDTQACLVAATADGAAIEGCDAIQTLPRWTRRSSPERSFRTDRGRRQHSR